ncbi:StbB family protein [Roseateles sp. NT4]|uniref:StbB family protein n=1 Tax=Roseateles sp. NT4 TaxID=3453715 RepID=UPI003EF006BC
MKVAVINFSGNVGKTTVARHLLLPRIPGAGLISIESINEGEASAQSLRGRQFGALQEYLQAIDSAVVDVGASNVEELLGLMGRYRGSHEDLDHYIVPTVSALKQQKDTIATLVELSRMGVPAQKIGVVFNMVEDGVKVSDAFNPLLTFLAEQPIAIANTDCRLGSNEVYERLKLAGVDVASLLRDDTDYKALIAKAPDSKDKVALARRLATRRLAMGVAPELDACFSALRLGNPVAPAGSGRLKGLGRD